mmetsp:Transcript_17017/g.54255  ORF Transcript_17017/g.54255 Transcript_17017/m.54255 type:complete len:279 (-) Transcript_17017:1157-1993(-)
MSISFPLFSSLMSSRRSLVLLRHSSCCVFLNSSMSLMSSLQFISNIPNPCPAPPLDASSPPALSSDPKVSIVDRSFSCTCSAHARLSTTVGRLRPCMALSTAPCPYILPPLMDAKSSSRCLRCLLSCVMSCPRSAASALATTGRSRRAPYLRNSRNTWCGCAMEALLRSPCWLTAAVRAGMRTFPKSSLSFWLRRVSTGIMRSSYCALAARHVGSVYSLTCRGCSMAKGEKTKSTCRDAASSLERSLWSSSCMSRIFRTSSSRFRKAIDIWSGAAPSQ